MRLRVALNRTRPSPIFRYLNIGTGLAGQRW
jgi:hypothetical protein